MQFRIILDTNIITSFIEFGPPAENIIAWNHILGAEGLPMVAAVLHIVVQTNLLQVLTTTESSVLYHDFQVAVRVFRAAVGLPELHGLQVLAIQEGIAADGNVLVVII